MRAMRIVAVLLCASTLALAAAGCGGGGGGGAGGTKYAGMKPDKWAANVCGAMKEWTQALQANSKKITPGVTSTQMLKTRLAGFLQASVRNADTMIASVKAAGPPAVKGGPKLQADLLAGLRQTRQAFENAIPRADALSATDPKAFSAGAKVLARDVNSELIAIGRDFKTLGTKYNDKDLNKATSNEPSCGKLLG